MCCVDWRRVVFGGVVDLWLRVVFGKSVQMLLRVMGGSVGLVGCVLAGQPE